MWILMIIPDYLLSNIAGHLSFIICLILTNHTLLIYLLIDIQLSDVANIKSREI